MKKLILSLFLLCFISGSLFAQDAQTLSGSSTNENSYKWKIRVRGLLVVPDETANIEAIGGDVSIEKAFVPEVDFTYYFTKNFAAELILGTTNHDVKAVNTAVGNIDLGDVWLLPPTLTFQYHWNVHENVSPYIGSGVNYTIFYGANEGPIADNIKYDNSFSPVIQFGIDFDISDRWFINLDAKYLFLNTDATIDATSALGATVSADVDINPFIAGIGIGVKL